MTVIEGEHTQPGITTLLVDDSPEFQKAELLLLQSIGGIQVIGTAATRDEALAMVEQHRPNLLVIDSELGGADGLALTRAVRSQSETVRVIIVMDHDSRRLEQLCREHGADAVVFRDRAPRELRGVIRQVFPNHFK